MSFCRCCLLDEPDLSEMKSVRFVHSTGTIRADEAYKFCNAPDGDKDRLLAIPEVDANPMICKMCLVQLESAYIFLKLCREATAVLESKRQDVEVKKEPLANEDFYSDDAPDKVTIPSFTAAPPSPKRERLSANGDDQSKSGESSPLPACFMQNKVQCRFCSRIFVTKGVGDSLWVHCFEHRGYEPFNCGEKGCLFQTRYQKNFRAHLAKSHRIEYDDLKHGYKEDYQSMVKYLVGDGQNGEKDSWHSNLTPKFECTICGMKFLRKIQQMRHVCSK